MSRRRAISEVSLAGQSFFKKSQPLGDEATTLRCFHIELVKESGKWKCTSCEQFLTIRESIENSALVSEALEIANASGRPLEEVFDDIRGRKEWEQILAEIPAQSGSKTGRKGTSKHGKERVSRNRRRTGTRRLKAALDR